MGKVASVVEINGVKYDAGTGRAISKVKDFAKTRLSASSQVIDGFVKNKRPAQTKPAPTAPKAAAKSKPKVNRAVSTTSKNIHSRTERSKTLVRTVVTKPSLRVKEASRTFTKPLSLAGTYINDRNKETRAKMVPKHEDISRYGLKKGKPDIAHPAHIGEVITRPSVPNIEKHTAQKASSTVMPSMVTSASHQHLERLLDAALYTATSHKKEFRIKRKGVAGKINLAPRWLSIGFATLLIVAGVLAFSWQNIPVVAVKIAGLRTSISASAPSYTPIGFTYAGPAAVKDKAVIITYVDKTDASKNYKITEEKSSLNSTSLASVSQSSDHQATSSLIGGNSVYIYDSASTATWVNNGIQYTISNNAGLSSDQLLRIVESIQ